MGNDSLFNRRKVLKTTGAGVVGTVGLSSMSMPVAAEASQGQVYDQKTMTVFDAGGGTYEVHSGAGLEVSYIDDDGGDRSLHEFKIAADVVVTERGGDEMPVSESEGYGDDCSERVDHPAAMESQNLNITIDDEDTSYGQIVMDSEDVYMSPTRCDGQPAYDSSADSDAASAAAGALSVLSALYLSNPYASATLAATLYLVQNGGDTIGDYEVDVGEYWSGEPFLRGGLEADFGIAVEGDNFVSSLTETTVSNTNARNDFAWDITCTADSVYVNQP